MLTPATQLSTSETGLDVDAETGGTCVATLATATETGGRWGTSEEILSDWDLSLLATEVPYFIRFSVF